MSAPTRKAQGLQTRESALQLAGLLMLVLIASGLAALFAAWSMDRLHRANTAELTAALRMTDESRSAQAQFKKQVQEWKNLLLRGADPAARSAYLEAFQAQGESVEAHLAALAGLAAAAGLPETAREAKAAASAHRALELQYRAALAAGKGSQGGAFSATEIDTSIRGLDRPLEQQVDRLAGQIVEDALRTARRADETDAARYATLEGFLWVAMAVSVILVGLILWRTLQPSGA
jgi:methyl-accepting chemotaxis protein-1 (serine sensor receptor)